MSDPKFRFYLDDISVSDPKGIEDITTRLNYDNDLHGFLITQEFEPEFTGDAYDYLKSKNYTERVVFKIDQLCKGDWLNIFNGYIHLKAADFNITQCSVKCKPEDNNYFSKIHNAKSDEWDIFSGVTKNQKKLPAIELPFLCSFRVFNPATGNHEANVRYGIRVDLALKTIVKYMTDNEMDYSSPVFGIGGEFEYLVLTTGFRIGTIGVPTAPFFGAKITYQQLFTELYNRMKLTFYIDSTGLKPKIIIDYDRNVFNGSKLIDLFNINQLHRKINENLLYSKLIVGCTEFLDDNTLSFPELIDLVGFKKETYNFLGVNNIDQTLDLSTNFITSSNIIEAVLLNANPNYDTDWFLIDCVQFHNAELEAKDANWLQAGPPFYYNERLTNEKIFDRFYGAMPDSVAKSLTPSDDTFESTNINDLIYHVNEGFYNAIAAMDGTELIFITKQYPNEILDGNNRWDNGVNKYTANLSGFYTFAISEKYNFVSSSAQNGIHAAVFLIYIFRVFDNVGNFKYKRMSVVTISQNNTQLTDVLVTASQSMQLAATDFVTLRFAAIKQEGTFKHSLVISMKEQDIRCTQAVTGQGIYKTFDPLGYPIYIFDFEYDLSFENFKQIKSSPFFSFDVGSRKLKQGNGNIKDMKYNHFTGHTTFELFSPEIRAK